VNAGPPIPVFVAAGSNVEPRRNLALARSEIAATWPDAVFSAAYQNPAVGFDGPDFINWVVGFTTTMSIDAVVERLRAIETLCGRPRHAPKWAPRSMDLDILLFGDRVAETANYKLPRPDLNKRPYMLGPMAEIAPHVMHPTLHRSMSDLWRDFDSAGHAMTRVEH
jgi:2-amino-4-hydroxy-6-hydroxymethyldihydropteridine diphosphokinase